MKKEIDASLAEQADQMVHDMLKHVIAKSYGIHNDIVAKALLFLMVRVSNTWHSIRTLQKYSDDNEGFMVDAGTLIRAMHDAYLQAEYLLSDRTKQLERAKDYFDFEDVERYKSMTKMLNANNWIANRLKASPKRGKGQEENERRFNAVKDRFRTKPTANSTRTQWYPGNLRQIAEAAGRGDEYDTILATFNGCVHSSASAVKSGPPVRSEHVLMMASTIAAKVTRYSVLHNKLKLSNDYQRLLDVLCNSPDDESN